MKEEKIIKRLKEEVENYLDRILPAKNKKPEILHQAMRYSVFSGGKRLRPVLILAMGETLGVDKKKLLPVACAIELIHNFSLIHDDLPAMDNDDFRRGKFTCHKKFDEAVAILSGDALLTLSFKILAESGNLNLIKKVADAIGSEGMAGGQTLDMQFQQRKAGEKEKKIIDEMKTGKLFQLCFETPLFFKKVPSCVERKIVQLGKDFGLAFQVRDDIEDCEGDKEKLKEKLKTIYVRMKKEIEAFGEKKRLFEKILEKIYGEVIEPLLHRGGVE